MAYVGADTASVEDVLERGLRLAETSPVHIAIRGTASASSVRCGWRGIARTPSQRERAVRFWLRLDEADEIPDASFLETMFTATMDTLNPYFRETAKSNFNAIARGGLSNEYMFLTCHARRPVLLQEQASRRRRGQEIPGQGRGVGRRARLLERLSPLEGFTYPPRLNGRQRDLIKEQCASSTRPKTLKPSVQHWQRLLRLFQRTNLRREGETDEDAR